MAPSLLLHDHQQSEANFIEEEASETVSQKYGARGEACRAKLGSWDIRGSRPVSARTLLASLFLALNLDTNLPHCLTDEAEEGKRIQLDWMALNLCPLRLNLIQVHGIQYPVISLTFHDTEGMMSACLHC